MILLRNLFRALSIVILLAVVPQGVHALPILFVGNVFNDGDNGNDVPGVGFSLIHESASPSGSIRYTFNTGDPLRLYGDVADIYAVTTNDYFGLYGGPITYPLYGGGGSAAFELTDLYLQVGDPVDSGPSGYVDAYGNLISSSSFYEIGGYANYTLTDGSYSGSGTFYFAETQYGTSAFNGIALSGDYARSFFLWGGDQKNYLGIDYAATVTRVPEPASMALLGGGLVIMGLTGIRRRRQPALKRAG